MCTVIFIASSFMEWLVNNCFLILVLGYHWYVYIRLFYKYKFLFHIPYVSAVYTAFLSGNLLQKYIYLNFTKTDAIFIWENIDFRSHFLNKIYRKPINFYFACPQYCQRYMSLSFMLNILISVELLTITVQAFFS